MSVVQDESALPEPWWDLRGTGSVEAEQRDAVQVELKREVNAGHSLYGRSFTVIARSQATDDVLIALDDGTWAVVHLTWRRRRDAPPWPRAAIYDSLAAAVDSLPPD